MMLADADVTMYQGSIKLRTIGIWGQVETWVCPKCKEITLKAVVV